MAGTSYTRQSTLTDGDTITASLFNAEYNQLVTAFSYAASGTTGHQHDGGAGEGGNIEIIGDQDFLNKIVVDSTNNRWGFFVEVSSSAVEQVRIQDGAIVPVTDSDIDLGTTSLRFKDTYTDTITTTGNVAVGGNLTVTGTATIAGNLTFGDAASDTVAFSADVASNLLPSADNTYDLGASGSEWKDLYIDGTANIDSLVADTADINGGTIDGAVIGGSSAAAGSFTTVGATGNITVGGTVDGRDVATDGTKLDGIEASADVTDTANVTAAGALMDSELTAIASVKALNQGVATGDSPTFVDVTATSLDISGNIDVDGTTNLDAVDIDGATHISGAITSTDTIRQTNNANSASHNILVATTNKDNTLMAYGVDRNGTVTGIRLDGKIIAPELDISGDIDVDGVTNLDVVDIDGAVDMASTLTVTGEITANGGIALGDSDQATFGASDDLKLYHTGLHSYIDESGTGNLYIGSNNGAGVYIQGSGETLASFVDDGAVTLYHDNSPTLATTSGGISVTGEVAATSLDISGNIDVNGTTNLDGVDIDGSVDISGNLNMSSSGLIRTNDGTEALPGLRIGVDNDNGLYRPASNTIGFSTGGTERMRVDSTGIDVTGTATMDGLTVDGTASVAATLNTSVNGSQLLFNDATAGTQPWNFGIKNDGTNDFLLYNLGPENVEIYTSGDLRQKIASNGDISFYEDTGTTAKLTWSAADEDLNFADNVKATFGAGDDLQIYHNENNSIIADTGTGFLSLQSNGSEVAIYDATNSQNMARFLTGADVKLFHNGDLRLATTATGIDVSGSVVADGLTVDGSGFNPTINSPSFPSLFTGSYGGGLHFQDTNYAGMYVQSSGELLKFYVGKSTSETAQDNVKLQLNSTGIEVSGNIEIASSSPKLSITNTEFTINNNDEYGSLDFVSEDGSFTTKPVARIQAVNTGGAGSYSALAFHTSYGTSAVNTIERMRLDKDGQLGIGTGTIYADLQVHAATGASVWITADGSNPSDAGSLRFAEQKDGFNYFEFKHDGSANSLSLTSTNGDIMTFDRGTQNVSIPSGNVLVGTTNTAPATNNVEGIVLRNEGHINVSRASGVVGYFNRKTNDGTILSFHKDSTPVGSIGSEGGDLVIRTGDTGIRFNDASNAIMPHHATDVIDNQIDIGHSSYRFKDLSLSGIIYGVQQTLTRDSGAPLELNRTTNDGELVYFKQSGVVRGSISISGSSTSYNTSSDYRLKEDWQPVENATDRLKELKPCNFAWKVDGSRVDGFLAHELQEVVPEAVTGEKDAMQTEEYEVDSAVTDEEGNVTTEAVMGEREVPDYQGIDQSKLVPLLVATIQELEARITKLENN